MDFSKNYSHKCEERDKKWKARLIRTWKPSIVKKKATSALKVDIAYLYGKILTYKK